MPGCRTSEEASLLIIRIVSKHTCLSAGKRGSDPPQSVPLQASSIDPISRRVNPSLVGRDFCRPSTKEIPSPSFKMLSSSAIFSPSLTPPPRWVSPRIPCETAAQWKRNEDKRITSVLISSSLFLENLEYYYSFRFAIRRLYTPAGTIVQTVWKHDGTQGNVVPETMVHRLAAFLRLLLLLFEINFSTSYCLSVFHLEIVM